MFVRQSVALSTVLVASFLSASFRQDGADGAAGQDSHNRSDLVSASASTQLATLYAGDPLTSSISLLDGSNGGVIKNHRAYNLSHDLGFGGYESDGLSIGKDGGSDGFIIDLGERADLMREYDYPETIGRHQGFSSIHLEDGNLVILKSRKQGTFQPLAEASALFDGEAPDQAKVRVGHIYLIRIKHRGAEEADILAKLIVLDHSPEASVTIRWELLE
ncbi:MAG: hypothetical protein ACI8QC_002585 [Planctomycetota bacterium]|jgi:hypothetical protein